MHLTNGPIRVTIKVPKPPDFADCIAIQCIVEVHSVYFFAQLCTYIGGTKIAEKGGKA